jgi:hypothetical protein
MECCAVGRNGHWTGNMQRPMAPPCPLTHSQSISTILGDYQSRTTSSRHGECHGTCSQSHLEEDDIDNVMNWG